MDLRDGRDDRARVPARRALLDGDRGRKPLDLLDVRLREPVEELPRVRAQALDSAVALLKYKRVEGRV